MTTRKPKVFIGSSQEALPYAEAIKAKLEEVASPIIWNEDIWRPGHAILEDLIDLLPDYDFAVLILGGEDTTSSRGFVNPSPRDNVIFELGLFMAHLGRSRTFFLCRKDTDLRLPSDLDGINHISFSGTPDQANEAVDDACRTMCRIINDEGVHEPFTKVSRHVGEAVFKWMYLSPGASEKLARSQLIRIGKTKEALTALVKSATKSDSILAICGYKGDYSSAYYQENFKKCKAVSRVFSYEAIRSEITVKKQRYALDGLKMHLDKGETGDCNVEVILIQENEYIRNLGGHTFDPPLSFGLTILRDENESPRQAIVHWEMDAEPLRDLIAIEGVIIEQGQKEVLDELVGLWKAIADSNHVSSSKKDENTITALYSELEEFWKSQAPRKKGKHESWNNWSWFRWSRLRKGNATKRLM